MRNYRLKYLLIMGIVLTLIAGLGATYSFFVYRETGSNVSLETGEISINYSNNVNYLTVPDAYPVSDTIGKIYPYYNDFTVNATTDNQAIQYEIQIIPRNNNTIDGKYIKVYLTDQNDNPITEPTLYTNLSDATHNAGKTVYTGYATKTSAKNFRLRVWIDESYTKNQKETFGFNIYLYAVNSNSGLYDILESALAVNLTESDIDGTRYVTGEIVNNNFVWYSGKMWRVVALNSDGTVKLVTQNPMTSMSWSTDSSNTDYSSSQMRTWLNTEFLPTINSDLIVDSKWDYTTYENFPTVKITENVLMVSDKVGLLSIYDVMMTGGTGDSSTSKSFLNIDYFWFTISPTNSTSVWAISPSNAAAYTTGVLGSPGVRPSVNLKPSVTLFGDGVGTLEDPYILEGDTKIGQTNEKLSTRLSGEYIKFNNVKYRIVGIENGLTKITMADYGVNKNALSASVPFGTSTDELTFSTTYGIGKYLDDWYNATSENDTSGTYTGLYLSETAKAMIATPSDGVRWYAGPDDNNGISFSYINAKAGTPIEATIGLPRFGEMFSSQFGSGHNTSIIIWLITKRNDSNIWVLRDGSDGYYSNLIEPLGLRPSFYLKSDVKITGGSGMPHDPYEITM